MSDSAEAAAADRDAGAEVRAVVRALLADPRSGASARELVDGGADHDPRLWARLAELGLLGLGVPEERGGSGGSWSELAAVLEELGRALRGPAFLPTVGLTVPLLLAADERGLLEAVLAGGEGPAVDVALAHVTAGPAGARPALFRAPSGPVLRGRVTTWCAGETSTLLALADRDGEPALVIAELDPSRTRSAPAPGVDLTRPALVRDLDGVPVRVLLAGSDAMTALGRAHRCVALAVAVESLGAARQCLSDVLEHVRRRRQFGRPIGSFQAVKHRLADRYVALESAAGAVGDAVAAMAAGDAGASLEVSLATAWSGEVFARLAAEDIQLHGGLGFTWEHDAHLYYRRAAANRVLFGSTAWHEGFAGELLVAGAAGPA